MTTDESAGDALFSDPLPEGFARRVFRVAPGHELGVEPDRLSEALVVVEQGEVELVCRAGPVGGSSAGSMIPIELLPISHLRSVGPGPLVLVAVSRARPRATDEFRATPDHTAKAEHELRGMMRRRSAPSPRTIERR